jgi:hypothetical protein
MGGVPPAAPRRRHARGHVRRRHRRRPRGRVHQAPDMLGRRLRPCAPTIERRALPARGGRHRGMRRHRLHLGG